VKISAAADGPNRREKRQDRTGQRVFEVFLAGFSAATITLSAAIRRDHLSMMKIITQKNETLMKTNIREDGMTDSECK
jgi:hypothetical protein